MTFTAFLFQALNGLSTASGLFFVAAGIAKAKSTDTEKLVTAFSDLKVDSPFGPFSYRASDHQATMGAYVGKIALEDGKGTMVDFKYVDGAAVLPSDAEVKKLRPAGD